MKKKLKTIIKRLSMAAAGAIAVVLAVPGITRATSLSFTVPGTADAWLAGMPDGTTASAGPNGNLFDTAPADSPVLVSGLNLNPGQILNFSASGAVNFDPSVAKNGPNGDLSLIAPHVQGAQNGIADITAPVTSLIGVFVGANQPSLSPAPSALDFSTPGSLDYTTLTPSLQQPFFIGTGTTTGGKEHNIVVPTGASALYLAVYDGWQNNNNGGAFNGLAMNVTISASNVPEPSSAWSTLAFGVVGASYMLKRKLNKQSCPR
jgi:hypothetical protein